MSINEIELTLEDLLAMAETEGENPWKEMEIAEIREAIAERDGGLK